MKTKQLELLVLTIAVLLAVGYTIIRFSGASADTARWMNIFLASGFAIYVGYVYITQLRDHRIIDTQATKIDELKHTVADREHQLEQTKGKLKKTEKQVADLSKQSEELTQQLQKAKTDWQNEVAELKKQLEEKA